MLWLVLDYSADILYGLDLLVRARTGECVRPSLGQLADPTAWAGGDLGATGQAQGDLGQEPLECLFLDNQSCQDMLPCGFFFFFRAIPVA